MDLRTMDFPLTMSVLRKKEENHSRRARHCVTRYRIFIQDSLTSSLVADLASPQSCSVSYRRGGLLRFIRFRFANLFQIISATNVRIRDLYIRSRYVNKLSITVDLWQHIVFYEAIIVKFHTVI